MKCKKVLGSIVEDLFFGDLFSENKHHLSVTGRCLGRYLSQDFNLLLE